MYIQRIINDAGEFRCFEIDNRTMSRWGMCEVISRLEGVKIVHTPKFYDDEVFCEFVYADKHFEVTEPYGDSSVFDIVAPENASGELELIAKHFEQSEPVRGGDLGHSVFFLATFALRSWLLLGVVYSLYRLTKCAVS